MLLNEPAMKTLAYYEEKIKEKRKNTPFDVFLREIASWYPLTLRKYENTTVTAYMYESERFGNRTPDTLYGDDAMEYDS